MNTMNHAVDRQQHLLAQYLSEQQHAAETARAERLRLYISALSCRPTDPNELEDLRILEREFVLPRNLKETYTIMDAGGTIYGIC